MLSFALQFFKAQRTHLVKHTLIRRISDELQTLPKRPYYCLRKSSVKFWVSFQPIQPSITKPHFHLLPD